jgi:hypothetical protein
MGRFLRRAHATVTPATRSAGVSMPAGDAVGDGSRGSPAGRRIAAIGAIALVGLAVHTPDPAEAVQLPGHGMNAADGPAARAHPASPAQRAPVQPGGTGAGAGQSGQSGQRSGQASSFRQIILPDLLIVAPKGLTARQVTRLRKIAGVRNMITFDGAEITAGSRPVNVIGVNPQTFRSWVPLRTASDQAFWTALAGGDFVAATGAGQSLALKPGAYYRLTGSSAQVLRYGMAARLGLSGVDLLVNPPTSARLGLVRQVAGLISAPGVSMATLTSKVSKVLGPTGRIEVLRGQPSVTSVPAGTVPTSYIQLFQASAADYCPGLSWTVLAAIGQIESADGTNMGPSTAGALGPMQFLPSTWARWGIDGFGQTGTPDVLNPYDAVPSAARLLCADGAAAGGRSLSAAIFDYNHADWYVTEVLALAAEYAADYR